MFQNINENTINIKNKNIGDDKEKINVLSNIFSKNNVLLYIVSFMLSLVGLNGEFSIFSVSMLGACFASGIPALGIIAISLIGNLIKYGTVGALGYFLT